MKNRPGPVIILIAIVGLIVASAVTFSLLWPKVYAGVTVEGVSVGGMDREEVRQMLTLWRQDFRSRQISAYYGDINFQLAADNIDFDIDVDSTVAAAWGYGHQGAWWERLNSIRTALVDGYRVPVKVCYREDKLTTLIGKWREAIDCSPRNAHVSLMAGGIIPQKHGRRLEVEVLKPLILQTLFMPKMTTLALPVATINPAITETDLQRTGLKKIWASYKTVFDSSVSNRSANIRLSASRINGYIVYPGKTFSFNEVVGPRDKEHGFKQAMEIVDGEFVPGIGGGVCQVSSTLYNAVLLANLPVTERTNHSKPLGYVDLGRDATVAYNVLDLKFVNNTDGPLMILAETDGNELMTGIVGQKTLPETVMLVSTDRKVIDPTIVTKPDEKLYLGETELNKQGKPGYAVTTVRVVYSGGREIKREVLSRDEYLPENTIMNIGTMIPPFARGKTPTGANSSK